jgi:hypothetical protein
MNTTLHLTIVNDSKSYEERKRIARAFLGSPLRHHAQALKSVVLDAANYERREFGAKFPAAALTSAALDVAQHDRNELLDVLRKVDSVTITGRRWFQRSCGNTYHTACILFGQGVRAHLPKEYGYGERWQQTAREWLKDNGFTCPVEVGSVYDVARESDL